ncbi:MAG: T9SS type A sorting domain-containing protein, partial [candidate division WOR-3 bacterium]
WSAPVMVDDNPVPVPIGWARIAADADNNLFAAWNGSQAGQMRIWSATSTDHGLTWSPSVRVDDDTVPSGCYHADVAIQPGTNHRLVTASAPYWVRPGQIGYHSYFYRSTDMGISFEPGVQLDSFDSYCGQPHVIADAEHIICDYSGSMQPPGRQYVTESRTYYTLPDTWGPRVQVSNLDTLHLSETNGAKLALSADGRVHTALMVFDLVSRHYGIFYAFSSDHGASWSDRERANDDSICDQSDPDIAVDSLGAAYVVWQDGREVRQEIWFATNAPLGVSERPTCLEQRLWLRLSPAVCRKLVNVTFSLPSELAREQPSISLFDPTGRRIRDFRLDPGTSSHWLELGSLPAGVYVVRLSAGTATAATRFVRLPD